MSTFDNVFFSIIDDGAAKLPFPTGKLLIFLVISLSLLFHDISKNIDELPKKIYYNRLRKKLFF